MSKRILLINSDLAKNRGDRAIAEGIISLAKERFPGASITGISQFPDRDREWYGIDFLDMDFQSLSPLELLRLCRAAKNHDIVLWGGGEILKDYTNKAALWYWVIKMTFVSLANRNLYGAYQGIGPTRSASSKRLIAYVVKRCKMFIVRDDESKQKLLDWGVPAATVRAASDPAVVPIPSPPSDELRSKLRDDFGIDTPFLNNFITIGPRDWFHYKPSGILPYKYKKRLYKLFGKQQNAERPEHSIYIEQLSAMVSKLSQNHDIGILLVPMHMEESDTELCRMLASKVKDSSRVKIVDHDTLSPMELRSLIGQAKAMVGFRLHSNIIGISANVPSLNVYYVDKGRVFFDQIGQSRFAMPIETVLEKDFHQTIIELFEQLLSEQAAIKSEINIATGHLRRRVKETFNEAFENE